MFGPCKVCAEKDKRVSSLETEIAFLRTLVRPPVNNARVSAVEYEADGVVSGVTEQIEFQSHSQLREEEDELVIAERDAILNGTY